MSTPFVESLRLFKNEVLCAARHLTLLRPPSKKDVVVFGPWTGEFSYELCGWAPLIRRLRRTIYKNCRAVQVGYIGREPLYRDFIDEYIAFTPELNKALLPLRWGAWIPDGNPYYGTPAAIENYFKQILNDYAQKGISFDFYSPSHEKDELIVSGVKHHFPPFEAAFLNPKSEIEEEVRAQFATFDDDREIVSVMARRRDRAYQVCDEDWNPQHWEEFIRRLVVDLDLNVVGIGVPQRGAYPGSLDVEKMNVYQEHPRRIKSLLREESASSLDYQLAVLKNVSCAIYGASGAAALPFFTKTPVFTQQTTNNARCLKLAWLKRLTGGHKNVCIFSKYAEGELYDTPVDELFEAFRAWHENK